MPRGVTFVVALPAVPLIFTRANDAGTRPTPNTRTRISTVARDCEVTTRSLLRATRKDTFSDGTAPATSPSLRRHVAKSRSAVPSCHAASSYDSASGTANRSARRTGARDRTAANGRPARNSNSTPRRGVGLNLIASIPYLRANFIPGLCRKSHLR